MNPQSYPAYRESGIEVIDDIPFNWETSKVAHIAKRGYKTFIDGDWIESPYITDWGVRLIQTGNVGVGAYKEQGFRYVTEETFRALRCTEVSPNDVLICRLADPVGRACLAPNLGVKMITSVDVCILKVSDDWDQRYVTYFLSSKPYLDLMGAVSRGGTRDRISRSFLGNVRIAKPNLSEQAAIADFLDRETAEADVLIAKYERLIELLEEKRIAVIRQAVTKGLDPRVPMKHSGVEWIGEIPNHWDIRALRHLGNFKSGSGFPDAEQGRYGEEIGFYKVGDLQYADDEGSMRDASHTVSPATARRLGATVFQTGTIVFAKVGAALMLNRYRVLSRPSCLDNNMMAFSLDWDVIEIEYALSLMPLLDLKRIVNPGALPSVNASQMKEEIAPVPPLAEQLQISRFISEQRRASRLLRARCETAISLTRERRSALITAAVTGQIDVSTYKSDRQAEAVA